MKRILLAIGIIAALNSYAQDKVLLKDYLKEIEDTSNYTFYYKNKWVDSLFVSDPSTKSIAGIKSIVESYGLNIYVRSDTNIFIYPNKIELERERILQKNDGRIANVNMLRIGDPLNYDPDVDYQLKGVVTDDLGESLVGVNVLVDGSLVTKTNERGEYALDLNPGNYQLTFSYVGLEKESRFVTFYSSGSVNISMFSTANLLNEVIVESNLEQGNSTGGSVGVQKIGIDKLEKLPSFAGDLDVVKGVTNLPGVSVSGESSSYLNIRGGANDQTLVLMNNTTIYNPGHLLGFFSVFNGDFISDVTVYKGNIPARYGIRASSVLDVKMNKWAKKDLSIYGGIGIANSNLGIKSKLFDDKLDLHFGGRVSYVNWMLNLVSDKDILRSSARFGDLNLSTRYLLNENNSIFFSSYFGSDFFRFSDKVIYRWATFNNSIKWTKAFNADWILETELLSSTLNNETENLQLNDEFSFENGIEEYSLKSAISNSKFSAGFDLTYFDITPGNAKPTSSNSLVVAQNIASEKALNIGVHSSYLISFLENFELSAGLRLNGFLNFGPSIRPVYEENAPFTRDNIVGQKILDKGEVASSRYVLEPRIGLNYEVGNQTLRAGYSRINQFLHLISNTVLINPSTVWKASDEFIEPTEIDQYSAGYEYRIPSKNISISVDGFYKEMNNLVEYRDGAELVLNENLEQVILRGKGMSYGVEFLITKDVGFLTGLVSYTYSRTFIEVNDEFQDVRINNGDRYPFYSDRPHNVKTSLDFKLSKKWTLSSNFTYITGAPISAPLNVISIDGVAVPLFTERNQERIPDYHRLDLVVTVKSRIRKTKKNNDRWVLTLYNVYGRDNVATIFFSSENDLPAQPFSLVNIGRIVPTLTYKFEF